MALYGCPNSLCKSSTFLLFCKAFTLPELFFEFTLNFVVSLPTFASSVPGTHYIPATHPSLVLILQSKINFVPSS
jgi:hypothetical protein